MSVFARLFQRGPGLQAATLAAGGEAAAVVLIDPNGARIATTDNGDGTSNLVIAGPGTTGVVKATAGAAANGQTLKVYTGTVSVATGATVTLETVTAGKTFYITDIYIGANTATQFQVTVNAASTAIFNAFCKGDTGPIQMPGLETQPSAAAGTVVQLVLGAAAATTAAYYLAGYEQ